ncbi:MAG: RluA family pseudouridine synthase [Tissierellia bacterium]|nr:RluA family pseudouridine synthase [Tissierellia bacterium]
MSLKIIGTEPGQRLDLFLSSKISFSRSQIQNLIHQGHVLVNGSTVKKNYLLCGGEEIKIDLPEIEELKAEDIKLDIIFEDEFLALINKPPGLSMHPGSGQIEGTLVSGLLALGWPLSNLGGEERPGIVHRLDKGTSGLVLIAKDNATHEFLKNEIQQRHIQRSYLALVEGVPKWDKLDVEGFIQRNPKKPTSFRMGESGRYSKTSFTMKENLGNYALLECLLDTGRTHQIRVHLKSIHFPVVGDLVYGSKKTSKKITHQMLHAKRLDFNHPRGQRMSFCAPLPEEFAEFLNKIRKTGSK